MTLLVCVGASCAPFFRVRVSDRYSELNVPTLPPALFLCNTLDIFTAAYNMCLKRVVLSCMRVYTCSV